VQEFDLSGGAAPRCGDEIAADKKQGCSYSKMRTSLREKWRKDSEPENPVKLEEGHGDAANRREVAEANKKHEGGSCFQQNWRVVGRNDVFTPYP
jgi:hypothetical protein